MDENILLFHRWPTKEEYIKEGLSYLDKAFNNFRLAQDEEFCSIAYALLDIAKRLGMKK